MPALNYVVVALGILRNLKCTWGRPIYILEAYYASYILHITAKFELLLNSERLTSNVTQISNTRKLRSFYIRSVVLTNVHSECVP